MQFLRGFAGGCSVRNCNDALRPLLRGNGIAQRRVAHTPQLSAAIQRNFFNHRPRLRKHEQEQASDIAVRGQSHHKPEKTKPARTSPGKTSLRRVAVEAERSRGGFIKSKGKRRFIDPEADTKKVTAFCAAEQYDINKVARLVRADGYELDPFHTGLFPQVVHVQTPIFPADPGSSEGRFEDHGDIFIFPSGTVVAWNVPLRRALRLVEQVLPPASRNTHIVSPDTEMEDLEYIEDPSRETSSVIGDTIVLGTKKEQLDQNVNDSSDSSVQQPEVDAILAKIAFSSGLARSTKLTVLENLTDKYFESTRSIPTMLSRGSRLKFTRSFILRKTGELLSIRAQLNLYSELTDSLPDLFWDSRHELGLEGYYDEVGRTLDVGVRIKVLNEKMDYAQEIASVLRETLSERHGLKLEWWIIALIAIEVLFEIRRLWHEYAERNDPNSMEALLRRYLEAAEKERISRPNEN